MTLDELHRMPYLCDCEINGYILAHLYIPLTSVSSHTDSSQFAPHRSSGTGFIRDVSELEDLDMSPQIPILPMRRHGSGRHKGVQDLEIQALGSPLLKHSPKGI